MADASIPYLQIYIGFTLVLTVWGLYLDFRQLKKNQETDPPSEIKSLVPLERFQKSQIYNVDTRRFGMFQSVVGCVVNLLVVVYAYPSLWGVAGTLVGYNEYYRSILWCLMTSFITYPIDIPMSFYENFVIEVRHGFNKMTKTLFFMDLIKGVGVSVVATCLVVPIVIYVVEWGGDHFYLYIWAVTQVLVFVFMFIYPTWIMPLYNKFEPLHDEQLRRKIEELAAGLNYPLQKLFQMDGSIRSGHSNAYMFGFWKNKRIVLYDTLLQVSVNLTKEKAEENLGLQYELTDGGVVVNSLLRTDEVSVVGKWNEMHAGRNDEIHEGTKLINVNMKSLAAISKKSEEELEKLSDADKVVEGLNCLKTGDATGTLTVILDKKPYTDDEILAILCHEIGHWYHAHVLRSLVITSVHVFILFRLYAFAMHSSALFQSFGYSSDERSVIVGLTLFSFMFTPVEVVVGFAMTALTRHHEYQADDFAVKMNRAEALGDGLKTLCIENLGDLNPDPLYALFHHSHPSLLERLQNMKTKDAQINKQEGSSLTHPLVSTL